MNENYAMHAVDPEVAQLAGDCASTIATDLGESPEAWRGAAVMARFIKSIVMADISATLQVDGELMIPDAPMTQLLTVGMLEGLPMWPPDVSGDPLITDEYPGGPRPHFQAMPNDN